MNDLAELIRLSGLRGQQPAWTSDGRVRLGAADIAQAASETARDVRRLAGSPSPVVLAALPLSVEALVLLRSAIDDDYTICFVDPAAPEERRAAVAAGVRPDVVVDGSGMRPNAARDHARPDMPPGYVAMSSGSVGGEPKGVLSAWSALAQFVPHGAEALELGAGSVWAEASHLSYDMAMTNILVAMGSGADVSVSAALSDRLRPLRFVDRVGASHLRFAPRFVDLAVAECRPAPAGLRVWGTGGDRLHAAHVRSLFELGVPTVVNTYGTSETVGFASTARFEPSRPFADEHGTVSIGSGAVGPWEAYLVPDEGHGRSPAAPVPASMLAIRTPRLPEGYLFGSSDGGFPRWVARDTVLTGDRGVVRNDELYCLGRAGRMVKRHGVFVDLDRIDASVRDRAGAASVTVLVDGGQLICLVEAADAAALSGLGSELRGLLSPELVPDRIVPVGRLPRLGNGKLDLAASRRLAEAALSDEL